ncbi:ribonucleotide reductase N-terminal alpha domain-containing protein [Thiocapsa marina]|uniref:Ribonucleoside-diphosphate reductase n=1 Tax=Thiocapsa marina 5811 TaxID=768671 RepID=F9U5J5_9GAMM|nr:ribonucleotide reductase N-terminal alpha domain-containing protein [Thiocapsa marina]EGV20418.1 Ribonucleotide reductase large subunit domain protein [Thiocapsa marina 5811]
MKDQQPTISRLVWETRYRAEGETDLDATRQRVACALASVEPAAREVWAARYLDVLKGFRFLPGGRILAGAGLDRDLTLFNCFVMGPIPDDLSGIFESLRDAALTMQQGGGVGCDFSTLRPAGLRARRVGGTASGSVFFMGLWDCMCATLLSTGVRRGAMMGTLRCDHPDIEVFIDAKRDAKALRNFNLSVLVTNDFMHAAYRTSVALAVEKGPFPYLVRDAYLAAPFVRRLPEDIRAGIASGGIRNSHLTAIAPTGTISLLANNLSSGIEPVFSRVQYRRVRTVAGQSDRYRVEDDAVRLWRERFGRQPGPPAFVAAHEVAPEDHLAMQAAVAPYVDNAISKTINVPAGIPFASFERLYRRAYDLGLKGCTTFRPNPVTGEILSQDLEARTPEASGPCCGSEREGD